MNERCILVRWADGKQRIFKGVEEVRVADGFVILHGKYRDFITREEECKVYERTYKKGWREIHG